MAFQEAGAGWGQVYIRPWQEKSRFWKYLQAGAVAKENVGMYLWNLSGPGAFTHTKNYLAMPR